VAKLLTFAAVATCLAFASAASAQDVRERASAFATEVALTSSDDLYARWNDGLCPSVAGLPAAEAQTLIDHIALRARAVGLDVAGPGCTRNLVIIFAPDARVVARELVDTRRDLLGFENGETISTTGRENLEAFAASDRPVRWWHIAYTVGADGRRVDDTDTRAGRSTRDALGAATGGGSDAVLSGGGLSGVEAVRSDGTRFRGATRQDIGFALVLVNAPQVESLPPAAVADYVAMAALVQLDPALDVSAYPSILNLFRGAEGQRPEQMTAWDLGYLEGLYRAQRAAASSRQQRAEIARRIERSVSRE